MSWDSYIDNLIAQSKDGGGQTHVDKVCIIGLDGGAQWTSNDHPAALKLWPVEAENIARCFKTKDFGIFMSSGVRIEGQTYMFLREDDGKVVYAKCKKVGGVTLEASKTAIVIAHCPEGSQQGNCNKGVAVIAEYFESLGM